MNRRVSPRLWAFVIALAMASGAVVVLTAADGPYNSNPPLCRTTTPLNIWWWYFDCMYPDPPDWGQVPG